LRDRGFKNERKSLKPSKRDRGFLKKAGTGEVAY
jgi:hypothetical protein